MRDWYGRNRCLPLCQSALHTPRSACPAGEQTVTPWENVLANSAEAVRQRWAARACPRATLIHSRDTFRRLLEYMAHRVFPLLPRKLAVMLPYTISERRIL